MKQLILIRGLSGSGKTTIAETICGDLESRTMVSADDFFVDDTGVYKFNYEALKEAHFWCQKECLEAMEDNYQTIVVHNTFTRKWECDPYMEMATQNDYSVQVINLYDGGLSDRQLSERCSHNVPSHVIQKQRRRWDKDVYREKRQPQPHYNQPHYNQPHYNQPHYNQPHYNQPHYNQPHYNPHHEGNQANYLAYFRRTHS